MNAKLVNTAAELIRRSMENGKQTPAGWAMDLESAQLLQSPATAAELERLRAYAENRRVREEELLAAMGRYDLVSSPDAWDLGMTVISHLEGPLGPSTPEEREPGLRSLIEQLRGRVAELEEQLAAKGRPVDEDPIAYALAADLAEEPRGRWVVEVGRDDRDFPRFHTREHALATARGYGLDESHVREDVTPQVRKLQALIAGQRDAAAAEAGERP